MKRIYAKELLEVEKYLGRSNRRNNLVEFQDTVKNEIIRNLETPRHSGMLAEVFSRADKCPTDPIKTDRKIAIKLYKWSRSSESEASPKPQDVHDIAGVTVVCNYPSDTDEVSAYLEKDFESRFFKFIKMSFRDPSKAKGYRAYHAVAKGLGKYNGLSCEVQIKTSLLMSWGTKTHDLTYKPLGEIDARLNLYMEKLSHVALILDEQSEILKSLIQDAWEMDEERRNAARIQLVTGIVASSSKDVQKVAKIVKDNAESLSVSSLSAQIHDEIIQMIDSCCEKHGYTRDICRVAALYALCRKFGDRNDWAIELIDDWIDSIKKDKQLENEALVFRSLICMALGEYEEAIETGRLVVERLGDEDTSQRMMLAQANLAYFLSEAYFHRAFDESSGAGEIITDATDSCALQALETVRALNASSVEDETKRFRLLDTVGAVLITCSSTEEEIRDGLEICVAAKQSAVGTPWESAARSFFSLHEKRAFKRLLAFK